MNKPKKKYNYTKKTGRPTTSLESAIADGKLPKNWKEIVVSLAAEGKTEVEIRAHLVTRNGLNPDTVTSLWYALKDREIEFLETIKISKSLCEAWWIDAMRNSLNKKFFQSAAWIFTMKNRFKDDWKDKIDFEHGINDEQFEKLKELKIENIAIRLQALIGNDPRAEVGGSKVITQAPGNTKALKPA